MGFFDAIKLSRLREGLTKTRESLVTKVNKLVYAKGTIDSQFISSLEDILITSDIGVETSGKIISEIQRAVKIKKYSSSEELQELIRETIRHQLQLSERNAEDPFAIPSEKRPYVIVVVGVNGVGKTTTIGKLAHNFKTSGKKVIIGAADTFRAAANEQLEIWAKRAGVDIIQQLPGSDPAAVAFDTIRSAQSRGADVVIIDTAGRLHTKTNLMEELKKIKRVMQKVMSDAPHETLLVVDATTGQNAIQQAKQFHDAVGISGLVLTKLDGTAKGGVVFAVQNILRVPIRFIGVGEAIDDLQPFDPKIFVDALFERELA